jgi:hypothetical protein
MNTAGTHIGFPVNYVLGSGRAFRTIRPIIIPSNENNRRKKRAIRFILVKLDDPNPAPCGRWYVNSEGNQWAGWWRGGDSLTTSTG